MRLCGRENMFQRFNNQIRASFNTALSNERCKTRPNAGLGLWLPLLVPTAVIVSGVTVKSVSSLYISCVIYSFNLLMNAIHTIYHVTQHKSMYVTKRFNILCAIPTAITMYLYMQMLGLDLRRSLCHSIANALIYFEGLPFLLKAFPKSFTFGEASIVLHGLSLFIYSSFIRLNQTFLMGAPTSDFDVSTTIAQVGLMGILLLCIVPYCYNSIRKVIPMYFWGIFIIGVVIIPSLHYILEINPLIWLLTYVTATSRVYILLLWSLCSIVAGTAVWYQVNIHQKASTVVRKYFHVLATIVFVSGILCEIILLYLSSAVVLGIFIALEVFRILKIPPLHILLQNGFLIYADEKDVGTVALTPIYLLVGCALPLWVHPSIVSYTKIDCLPILSGVLSIGIGDTCASICGKTFGRHHWPGSKKTIEGTIGCILGQMSFVVILALLNYIPGSAFGLSKSLLAVLLVSMVEATTDQIDNLVLPLIMVSAPSGVIMEVLWILLLPYILLCYSIINCPFFFLKHQWMGALFTLN